MSDILCELYQQLQRGESSRLLALREQYDKKMAQKHQALSVVQQNTDSDEDEEEEAHDVPLPQASAPKAPREPVIDDDGFELVQKPRRR